MTVSLLILLILSVFAEGTVITLPVTLICLICYTVMKRDTSVFLPAFLAGLCLDLFRVHTIGSTSIFYIGILFLILLYQKKYEIYSTPFVFLATGISTWLFLTFFGGNLILLQSLTCAFLACVLFASLRFSYHLIAAKQKMKFL